ncbi:MAG TPA: hypothetical protein DET40_18235, partial [Lentisphaeria bacterium]|nr:hypothetical protein [Lentisphaeria bacterium]
VRLTGARVQTLVCSSLILAVFGSDPNGVQSTKAWKKLMEDWRKQSVKDKSDRKAFKRLLRPNAKQKKKCS